MSTSLPLHVVEDALDARLPSSSVVAAVGSSAAASAARLVRPDRRVVVVTPEAGRASHAAVPAVLGHVGQLPLATASVDGAWIAAAALRPPHPEPSRALAELHRVVRPGGPILVVGDEGVVPVASAGPPAIVVRGLRTAEAQRVGELTLAAYDRYGRIEGPYRDFLADPLQRVDGCTAVLVAELAGSDGDRRVVGTVSYVVPSDPEWEDRDVPAGDAGFRVLAVDPAAEGRGVGSALVDACVARAREDGARRMLLISMAWMHRAHALYTRRYGFVRRPDLDVRFPAGVGVILSKDLTPDAAEHFPPPGPVPDEPPWFTEVLRGR